MEEFASTCKVCHSPKVLAYFMNKKEENGGVSYQLLCPLCDTNLLQECVSYTENATLSEIQD